MAPKLSPCIKELSHFMKDDQNNTIEVKPENLDPNFDESAAVGKLRDLFNDELDKPRSEPVVTDLGISTFRELADPPHQLKIALVDLTGDVKKPQYVELDDMDRIIGCSLSKIIPIYAAHQLKFDALVKAEQAPVDVSSDPAKKLKWTFDQLYKEWRAKGVPKLEKKPRYYTHPILKNILINSSAGELIFEPQFKQRMWDITHGNSADEMNAGAGYLIAQIRYPYMASSLLKAGLLDTDFGGLWLSSGYTISGWKCKGEDVKLFARKNMVTAFSAATYLTLLAQGRLISSDISKEIREVLRDGDVGWLKPQLQKALNSSPTESPYSSTVQVFGKHGMCARSASEGMLIERDSSLGKKLQYVVACIIHSTEIKPTKKEPVTHRLMNLLVQALIPSMDAVIMKNNTP